VLPHPADNGPPPPAVVSLPGPLGIPALALTAYRNAERVMARAMPGCGVSWNLLAGIGRIESMHAFGGATDARGNTINPIYGPALDGTLPGNEIIVQSSAANGGVVYARAMGPMQFLPDTWRRYAADRDNPQNLFDSTLAAARYLCSGGLNLRDQSQVLTAVMRYNNSMSYTQNVLGWAAAYATGVPPMNLPPIEGPIPPLGNMDVVVGSANVDRTGHGAQPRPRETSTGDPGNRGDDALDKAGGDGDAGSPPPRVSSSRSPGATNAGDGDGDAGSPPPRVSSSRSPGATNAGDGGINTGKDARSGTGGNGGAANVGNGVGPWVKFGDGRNGGVRAR
jgi:hypothetical protein